MTWWYQNQPRKRGCVPRWCERFLAWFPPSGGPVANRQSTCRRKKGSRNGTFQVHNVHRDAQDKVGFCDTQASFCPSFCPGRQATLVVSVRWSVAAYYINYVFRLVAFLCLEFTIFLLCLANSYSLNQNGQATRGSKKQTLMGPHLRLCSWSDCARESFGWCRPVGGVLKCLIGKHRHEHRQ